MSANHGTLILWAAATGGTVDGLDVAFGTDWRLYSLTVCSAQGLPGTHRPFEKNAVLESSLESKSVGSYLCPVMRSHVHALIVGAMSIIVLLFMSACEIPTSISVEGGNVPVFRLLGTGSIHGFGVAGDDRSLWRIVVANDGVVDISKLGPIRYGVVPPGFVQKFPEDGAEPAPLQEGMHYSAGASTINSWPGHDCQFMIRNGRAFSD
ncbi:MAG TPA: hypothetical protein VI756_06180 [Blastocatellia bacterium]